MPETRRIFLNSKISKGLFEDERIVKFTVADKTYTAIVDREDVEESEPAREREWVDGRLQVYIVKENGTTVLISLPRETTTSGRRLSVPQDLLTTVQ